MHKNSKTDLLIFPSNFSISISTKIHSLKPQSKENFLVNVVNSYLFIQLLNLTGNLMVYYTVAKIY